MYFYKEHHRVAVYSEQMLKIICTFFIALVLSSSAWGEGSVPVRWEILHTAVADAALEEIDSLPKSAWAPVNEKIISQGYASGALWLKTAFQAPEAGTYVLELANPFLDHVKLTLIRSNKLREVQTGGLLKPYEGNWTQRYHHEVFEFNLAAGEQVQLYLQGNSYRALIVWPRLYTKSQFFENG